MSLKLRKILLFLVAVFVIFIMVWFAINPPGRFGRICGYAYTVYGSWPRLISDFQIRADGEIRVVEKTHELAFENIAWLLETQPEVLIISLGWDGVVWPDKQIKNHKNCEIHLLKNKDAIRLYNKLKDSGKRVAIHYHSTC